MSASRKPSSQLESALKTFKMRSPDREISRDQARISSIIGSIDGAVREMVVERTGLIARVKAIVDQPEIVLKRKLWQHRAESSLSAEEFFRAEARLNSFARQISDLGLLKASILEKFSGPMR